jgi:hypothetical protein
MDRLKKVLSIASKCVIQIHSSQIQVTECYHYTTLLSPIVHYTEVRDLGKIKLNNFRRHFRKKCTKFWYKNIVPVSENEGLSNALQSIRKNTSFSATAIKIERTRNKDPHSTVVMSGTQTC